MTVTEPLLDSIFWPPILDLCEEMGVDCAAARQRLSRAREANEGQLPLSESQRIWDMICPFDSDNPALTVQISEIVRPYRLGALWIELGDPQNGLDLVLAICQQFSRAQEALGETRFCDHRITIHVRDPLFQPGWQHKLALAGYIKGLFDFLQETPVFRQVALDFPRPPADIDWNRTLGCPVKFDAREYYLELDPDVLARPSPLVPGVSR